MSFFSCWTSQGKSNSQLYKSLTQTGLLWAEVWSRQLAEVPPAYMVLWLFLCFHETSYFSSSYRISFIIWKMCVEKQVGLEKKKVDGKKREKGFNSKYPRLHSYNLSVSSRHSWLVFPWSFDIQWGGWLRDPKLALALNCLLEESVPLHWL